MARPRRSGGKWIFLVWDAERTLVGGLGMFERDTLENIYHQWEYPLAKLFIGFMDNPRFRRMFLEEFERHLAGVLHESSVLQLIRRLSGDLGADVPHEMQLWAPHREVSRWNHNIWRLERWARNREGVIRKVVFDSPRFAVSPEPSGP
jgi:hypothetical protein